MAPRRSRCRVLVLTAACAAFVQLGRWDSLQASLPASPVPAFAASPHRAVTTVRAMGPAWRARRRLATGLTAGLPGFSLEALEEMAKDPKKMKELQAQVEAVMKDPEKRKAIEQYQQSMQSAVEKLKGDPEMKDFFDDIEKNGADALKKYENDERILQKFTAATGGPPLGLGSQGAPPWPSSYQPGDQVIISDLEKAPELNGRKAIVVPPTADERKTLEGTGRVIVRLLDTGDQFAVRPANLRIAPKEVGKVASLPKDFSLDNPAFQAEAAKLRESGKLDELENDPELKPMFEDIKKNGMSALSKYWSDEKLMAKISKAMGG